MKMCKVKIVCGMMVIFLLMTVLYLPIFASDSSLPSLTPNGNMTLVDDYVIGETQYITVQTKNGNYFYIIIDRSGETDNVHFLNKVDDADLLPLIEDESIFDLGTGAEGDEEPPVIEPDDKAEQRKEVLTRGLVLAGIFAAVGGGIYIISKKKPKAKKEKSKNDDDDTEDAVSENTYVRDSDSESEVTVYENDANDDEDEYEDD